jgi:hypothetical protein
LRNALLTVKAEKYTYVTAWNWLASSGGKNANGGDEGGIVLLLTVVAIALCVSNRGTIAEQVKLLKWFLDHAFIGHENVSERIGVNRYNP